MKKIMASNRNNLQNKDYRHLHNRFIIITNIINDFIRKLGKIDFSQQNSRSHTAHKKDSQTDTLEKTCFHTNTKLINNNNKIHKN